MNPRITYLADNYLQNYYCPLGLMMLPSDQYAAMLKFAEWIDSCNTYNIKSNNHQFSMLIHEKLFHNVEIRKLMFTLLPYDLLWSDMNVYEQYARLMSAKLIFEDDVYRTFKNDYFDKYVVNDDTFIVPETNIQSKLSELWV